MRERVWRKGVRMILMDLYNYPHVCLLPTKSILFLSSSAMSTSTPQRRKKRISAYFSCSKDGNSVIRCRAYATDSSVPSPLPSPDQKKATDLTTLFRRLWKVAAPYWSSDDKVQARLQLAGVFALTLATTGISVGFNFLGRDFFNALANKDQEQFTKQLLYYLCGFAVGIPVSTLLHFLVLRFERLCKRHTCFEMEVLDDKLLHGTLPKKSDILQNPGAVDN